MFEYFPGTNQY